MSLEFEKPRVVCLCGSTRFMEAFRKANLDETLQGRIVLSIGCDTKSDDHLMLSKATKEGLDCLHKRKIDLCDEILVLNCYGYIGNSTRSEINYAKAIQKKIRYLEEPKAPSVLARELCYAIEEFLPCSKHATDASILASNLHSKIMEAENA